MDLLHALVIGAYGAYAALAGVYVALRDKLDELRTNHLTHLEERIKHLEDAPRWQERVKHLEDQQL